MTLGSNPYVRIVAEWARLQHEARAALMGELAAPRRREPEADAPSLLLLSPHPDDEAIAGGLALRLALEAGWRIVNVPITLGSNAARRSERRAELARACDYLGFELADLAPAGLERINLETRRADPQYWSESVRRVAESIARHAPRALLCPHADDWNATHIGTHQLVIDALTELTSAGPIWVVESEFWRAMAEPNLMLELGVEHVAELVAALTFHVGEVRRNPYHAFLPAWMADNVRRGAELVLGQGAPAPSFDFAVSYRVRCWRAGVWTPLAAKRTLSLADELSPLFG